MSFKQHPEEARVAETPEGIPASLNLDEEGLLKVTTGSAAVVDPSGGTIVSSPTLISVLGELLLEVKKSNIYLSLLVGEEVSYSDIEE